VLTRTAGVHMYLGLGVMSQITEGVEDTKGTVFMFHSSPWEYTKKPTGSAIVLYEHVLFLPVS
jgi:hypothetical protein